MPKVDKTRFQLRRHLAAEWTALDEILLKGEPGFETDTGKLKIGDGSSRWSALSYVSVDHSNANDPTSDEKAAMAGTSGTPGSSNKYVTNDDARNTDARTPTSHTHAATVSPFLQKTTAEMNAIASPTEGMAVWNTTEHQLYVYDGVGWVGVVMQA
jgi:hypothetical protein